MHPRYLVGPTIVVVGIVILMAIGLWAMGPKPKDPNQIELEQLVPFETDQAVASNAFMKRYKQELVPQLIGGVVVMAIVFMVPMKRGPMFVIVKPLMFVIGAYVTNLVRGAQTDSAGTMFKILVIGAMIAGVVAVIRYFQNAFPATRYPAHFRWSNPAHLDPTEPEDEVAMARLEHFRAVVAATRKTH